MFALRAEYATYALAILGQGYAHTRDNVLDACPVAGSERIRWNSGEGYFKDRSSRVSVRVSCGERSSRPSLVADQPYSTNNLKPYPRTVVKKR